MSGPKHFDDLTHWDRTHADGNHHEPAGGWYRPGENYFISLRTHAGTASSRGAERLRGPNIHYDTDNHFDERHLVFDDGTKLPAGWHHRLPRYENGHHPGCRTGRKTTTAQYLSSAMTESRGRRSGRRATARSAIATRRSTTAANNRATIGRSSQQRQRLSRRSETGILTPKNNNGDHYTLGPGGKKSFFDKNGAPITEDQFNNASKPRHPGQTPGEGLHTDEQQSGKAADAVKKLQQELKSHYSKISDAEEKLSEVLLTVQATTSAGQHDLNGIQKKIVDAVNDPSMDMDTPAGERSFLTFLRNQVSEINNLLDSGGLSCRRSGQDCPGTGRVVCGRRHPRRSTRAGTEPAAARSGHARTKPGTGP